LTFKLVRARDQTRLPCEFGANPFSGSRHISYTKSHSARNKTLRSSLRAVKILKLVLPRDAMLARYMPYVLCPSVRPLQAGIYQNG